MHRLQLHYVILYVGKGEPGPPPPPPPPRQFHSIEKLDIRSRPQSLLGDRQLNPSYRMAMECGLSFFNNTLSVQRKLTLNRYISRGLKQYKFHLCCLYLNTREESAETACALFSVVRVNRLF